MSKPDWTAARLLLNECGERLERLYRLEEIEAQLKEADEVIDSFMLLEVSHPHLINDKARTYLEKYNEKKNS